jgi:putative transposase
MGNTYIQVYLHAVFAVKHRQNLIQRQHRTELEKFTTGILNNRQHIPVAVSFMGDHAHVLFGLGVNDSLGEIMGVIKANTSRFINEKRLVRSKFEWQTGYGIFACGRSGLDTVAAYVFNQEQHHAKQNFKTEFLEFLRVNNIDYDPKYLFNWISEDNDP